MRTTDPQPGRELRYPDVCAICHEDMHPGDRYVCQRGRRVHCACHSGQDEGSES